MNQREYLNITTQVAITPQDASYIVSCSGTATASVEMTMKKSVIGNFTGGTLVFSDNNPSNDTITRSKGSWIDDGFDVGMTITVAGTFSNDNTYTIETVTDAVLTITSGGALTAEATSIAIITGAIQDADWIIYDTLTAAQKKFAFIEGCGTGLRFKKTGGTGTVNVWVQS